MTEPVIYTGTSLAKCSKVPSAVLKTCMDCECSECHNKVKVVRKTFEETAAMARKHNRPVIVLCETCIENEVNEDCNVALIDEPDIRRTLQRSRAEMN